MTDAATSATTALEHARRALAGRRWADAMELLPTVDVDGQLTASDLAAYGEAAWWTGQLGLAIALRERAFEAQLAAGERANAALTALMLGNDYSHRLESALASGWVRRAERLLADLPESREHGYLERPMLNAALARGDFEEALRRAGQILAIAARTSDPDLEALGLQDKGRALVGAGRVEEGMALLDEAVVAAVSGRVSPYPTAVVYCNATVACGDLTDYRRAGEFAEIARRWCERQSIAGFPGMCRVRRVEIIRLRGAWAEAEAEARRACAELQDFSLDYAGEGFYQIGEIRLRTGDLDGADAAFRQAHDMGRDPQPGLALLRRAQGRRNAAASMLARMLSDRGQPPLLRARLLPAAIELFIETDAADRASAAAAELETIAAQYGTHVLRASAATGRGAVALAEGDVEAAIDSLRRASRIWQETDAPYEVARVRRLLGEAYLRAGDPEAAAMELTAAGNTFARLGAAPDLAALDGLRRGAASAAAAPSATRAVRTFMFTDIVRSTNLLEAIGDEAWSRLRGWHDETLRSIVREHHGEEIDHTGDGFFVAFPSADDALACALAIRHVLAEHRERHGFAPSLRIGLHTGDAIQSGGNYQGHGVHVAARIGALAGADEILVSSGVLAAAATPPPHGQPREERLRGISNPVEVATLA
jgi:class 3 adenylate cyclase